MVIIMSTKNDKTLYGTPKLMFLLSILLFRLSVVLIIIQLNISVNYYNYYNQNSTNAQYTRYVYFHQRNGGGKRLQ